MASLIDYILGYSEPVKYRTKWNAKVYLPSEQSFRNFSGVANCPATSGTELARHAAVVINRETGRKAWSFITLRGE